MTHGVETETTSPLSVLFMHFVPITYTNEVHSILSDWIVFCTKPYRNGISEVATFLPTFALS
jgi:hypothetical protein